MSSSPLSSSKAVEKALSAGEIEARLEVPLDPVLSSRRRASDAAQSIGLLERAQQEFILHWVEVIARTSPELAFQFSSAAAESVSVLGLGGAERWIVHAMDIYDRDGLYRGSDAFRNWSGYAAQPESTSVSFDEAAPVLRLFVQALAGRALTIEAASHAYTDTERIFLPHEIDRASTRSGNFLLYKAATAMLWAQSRFGTFDVDVQRELSRFPEAQQALDVFTALETYRLEAVLTRELPGLARDVRLSRTAIAPDPRLEALAAASASVHDSIALVDRFYGDAPPRSSYEVRLDPALAIAVRDARIAREKAQLQDALAKIAGVSPEEYVGEAAPAFALERAGRESDAGSAYTLTLGGDQVAAPAEVMSLLESIEQDLGCVPIEYLTAAPSSEAQPVPSDAASTEPAHVYDEWDYQRRHYRKQWCEVREHSIDPGDPEFVERTARKYQGSIAQLKRTFELLRGEDRVLRAQPDGEELDYDALTEAYVDMTNGDELAPLVFARRQRAERNLAALFMIDMSGSTKGWINDAEREALVMLCEALETLGDRYAIYGFSGMTRKKCQIFRVKGFDEAYDEAVRGRIAGIEAQDYTRMGAAIRHLTHVLNAIDARTRLLVTLSDGRPDDFSDNYRGEYGIEDTRQALLEAHRSGVKPFCITIDRDARDYLPHMYGSASWTLVHDVAKLPLKVAETYAKLTR